MNELTLIGLPALSLPNLTPSNSNKYLPCTHRVRAGHRVTGVFMKNWDALDEDGANCPFELEWDKVQHICGQSSNSPRPIADAVSSPLRNRSACSYRTSVARRRAARCRGGEREPQSTCSKKRLEESNCLTCDHVSHHASRITTRTRPS